MRTYDIVIIGGSAPGIEAAISASKSGLKTLLIEREEKLGGQLRFQNHKIFGFGNIPTGIRTHELAELLEKKTKQCSFLKVKTKTLVYNISNANKEKKKIHITQNKRKRTVLARKITIATGHGSQSPKFIGAALPGIISLSCAQRLLHKDHVIPGQRIVILGTSDPALFLGWELLKLGVLELSFVEPKAHVQGNHLYFSKMQKHGIPCYLSSKIKKAEGKNHLEYVFCKNKKVEADVLIIDSPYDEIPPLARKIKAHIQVISSLIPQPLSYQKLKFLTRRTDSSKLEIAKDPAESTFLLEKKKSHTYLTFPWELYPIPKPGSKIKACDKKGKFVDYVKVTEVEEVKKYHTYLVTVQIKNKHRKHIQSLERPCGLYSLRNPIIEGFNIKFGDVRINNIKHRIHTGTSVAASLWEKKIMKLGSKRLFCNTGECGYCEIKINGKNRLSCQTQIKKGTKISF